MKALQNISILINQLPKIVAILLLGLIVFQTTTSLYEALEEENIELVDEVGENDTDSDEEQEKNEKLFQNYFVSRHNLTLKNPLKYKCRFFMLCQHKNIETPPPEFS